MGISGASTLHGLVMPNFTEQQYKDYLARMHGQTHSEQVTPSAVEDESELHRQILDECRRRGWIPLHGSMIHRTFRTVGEPDFTIVADNTRVFFVECKSKTGKLSMEQLSFIEMAKKLKHEVHVVRSFEEFLGKISPGSCETRSISGH